jgi:thioredoxin reductase|tara:strand:+ start:1933 stop:3024 length:1092 start_codon:yes stop_codon:yes gene_type:complete
MGKVYDLIIIGAGPAGLAAAIKAKEIGLTYLIIEKGLETLSGIIEFYPAGKKIYPTIPKGRNPNRPIPSLKPPDKNVTIEEYVKRVKSGIKKIGGVTVKKNEEFLKFKKGELIEVETCSGRYKGKNLILAIGSNIPRDLEVYGEARLLARTLHNPENYSGNNVLVIGGGNTGADVVITLSRFKREQGDDTTIYWAHRRGKFKVERGVARDLGEELLLGGNIQIFGKAKPRVAEVDETGIRRLIIRTAEYYINGEIKLYQGMSFPMKNVISCIGYCGPTPIFERLGLELMKHPGKTKRTELIVLDNNYQTSIKGVYAIGGAISPSYIKRTKGRIKNEEIKHPNLIFTAVEDGVAVAEYIKTLNL